MMVYSVQHFAASVVEKSYRQAEILSWASSSVHLDTVIFQYCLILCITMLYITNATAEDSIVGERDFSYYTQ